jgi:hypothetical protein
MQRIQQKRAWQIPIQALHSSQRSNCPKTDDIATHQTLSNDFDNLLVLELEEKGEVKVAGAKY